MPEGGHRNDKGSPSPLVRWIEEFQLSYGLGIPPYVGYYDVKGDPDDFIHVFEGETKMEKLVMSVSCHMFIYILKDAARVWWNSLPKGVVSNYKSLKKRKEGENVRAFITRYTDKTAQILKLNENQRMAGFVHGVKIKSLIKFISTELPKSYDGLMDKVYSWLQAEETATEGRPVTFMDNGGGKPQKGRPGKG
ncbi:hypothetical protein Tco_0529537 [Tanacetum coccineum]